MQKEHQKALQTQNIYQNSFIKTERILDDTGEAVAPQTLMEPAEAPISIRYHQLHELPLKTRLDIVYFLCCTKIDNENSEFYTEAQHVQSRKNEFKKILMNLQPFIEIKTDIDEDL